MEDRWRELRARPSLLGGLVLIATCVWAMATSWSPIVHGHPSYPILYLALVVLGGGVVVRGLRDTGPPRTRRSAVAAVGLVVLAAAALWLAPFAATTSAIEALDRPPDGVRVIESWTAIVLEPADEAPTVGLVFHAGARVDARAYAPTLLPLAEAGYLVIVVKEPLGIAFVPGGSGVAWADRRGEITSWAVGGHSLGGVVAASEAAAQETDGLVLWASYPASDISDRPLEAASIYGTNDGLTEEARVIESVEDLPPDTRFVPIEGAVHAHFGDYGAQPGDGEPAVDRDTAQRRIVEATLDFLEQLSDTDRSR